MRVTARSRPFTVGSRRGSATLEFALLLPVLTMLLLFTIDFCRIFYAYYTINNCALNAAVWASDPTHPYYANVTAAAQGDASNLGTLPTVGANDPVSGTDANGNSTVTVTVSYNFTMITSYLFGTRTIPMSRSVTMRVVPLNPT
jgi:Flp pilus assembly protein TadG